MQKMDKWPIKIPHQYPQLTIGSCGAAIVISWVHFCFKLKYLLKKFSGGHLSHIRDWFNSYPICASYGCDCLCLQRDNMLRNELQQLQEEANKEEWPVKINHIFTHFYINLNFSCAFFYLFYLYHIKFYKSG